MIAYTQEVERGRVANRKAFVAMEERQITAWHAGDAALREIAPTRVGEPTVREVKAVEEALENPSLSPTPVTRDGRPDPQWVRGRCPECGDDLVSNMYYVGGQGYLMVWECWGARSENGACSYRRVL